MSDMCPTQRREFVQVMQDDRKPYILQILHDINYIVFPKRLTSVAERFSARSLQ